MEDQTTEVQKHFVCRGSCGATSTTEQACGTEGCTKNGQPMNECSCTDGEHKETSGGWI